MLFLYDNLIDRIVTTLTASSEAAGFPASNLKNPFRTKTWKTAGATAGTAQVVINLSSLWSATGSNLVTNGGFDANTNGWTPTDCTLASVAGGDSGNCLQMTRTGGTSQVATWTLPGLTAGKQYCISAKIKSGTTGSDSYQVAVHGISIYAGISAPTWQTETFYFVATGPTADIKLTKNSATAGTMLFDTVSVYEMAGGTMQAAALTGYDWAVAPGTLQIEFNVTSSWASPLATETLTWVSGTTPGGNKGSIIKKFAADRNYRYARLSVVNSAGDWNLGRLFLGPFFELQRCYAPGYSEAIVDPSLISRTIGGQDHADEVERYRVISCRGIFAPSSEWVSIQAMVNAVGTRKPIFAAFDYENEAAERTLYGKFTSVPKITKPFNYEWDFEFAEAC